MQIIKIVFLSAFLLAATGAMADPAHDQGSSYQVHNGHFKRGERLTSHYREDRYVVNDYSQYRLRQPPNGYRWVRDDDNNDFVLAAITTGVIADVIANQH